GALLLGLLKEPRRGQSERLDSVGETHPLNLSDSSLRSTLREILGHPMVRILMVVFVGANFVAMIFLTWMPSFLYHKFGMSLSMAGLSAPAYLQVASVLGVSTGGVLADRVAQRRRGGRMWIQSIGLVAGVPFIF